MSDNFLSNMEIPTLIGGRCGSCMSATCAIISLQTQKDPTVHTLVPKNSRMKHVEWPTMKILLGKRGEERDRLRRQTESAEERDARFKLIAYMFSVALLHSFIKHTT